MIFCDIANFCLLFSNLQKGRFHYIYPVVQSVGVTIHFFFNFPPSFSFSVFRLLFQISSLLQTKIFLSKYCLKIRTSIKDLHCLLGLVLDNSWQIEKFKSHHLRKWHDTQRVTLDSLYNSLHCFSQAQFPGATHEMMRPDRDLYVKILHENLLPGDEIAKNFKLKGLVNYSDRDTPFDFDSVMMYGPTDFGVPNGAGQWKTTIEPRQPGIEIRCLKKSCHGSILIHRAHWHNKVLLSWFTSKLHFNVEQSDNLKISIL